MKKIINLVEISDIKVSDLQFSSYSLPFKVVEFFKKLKENDLLKFIFKLSESSKMVKTTPKSMVVEDDSKLYIFSLNEDSKTVDLIKTIENVIHKHITNLNYILVFL